MAVLIKNGVPYEARIQATDAASGKDISNLLYYKYYNPIAAYGSDVPLTDLNAAAADVVLIWNNNILPLLNGNWNGVQVVIRAIMGHRYPSPLRTIVSATSSGGLVGVTTATPHGFSNHQSVQIQGSTSWPALNGYWADISVVSASSFSFVSGISGGPGSNGTVQQVRENQEFIYGDQVIVPNLVNGGATGQALPIYCTGSARRLNTGSGRNWRSRCSISILNEPDQVNGRFETAVLNAWMAAWNTAVTSPASAGPQVLDAQAVSRYLAFASPSPFAESNTWTRPVTGGIVQKNLGSLIRRKPKLTTPIT